MVYLAYEGKNIVAVFVLQKKINISLIVVMKSEGQCLK